MNGKELQKQSDTEVCEAAEKFSSLFYEAFDKRRQLVNKMYTDSACLVWNGHPITGQDNIAKFFDSLPTSIHTLKCLDAQAVSNKVTDGQNTMLLHAAGSVDIQDRLRYFTQTFIVTQIAVPDKGPVWKIASDRYRFID